MSGDWKRELGILPPAPPGFNALKRETKVLYKERTERVGMQAAVGAAHFRIPVRDGARVASQQNPILHSGGEKVSKSIKGVNRKHGRARIVSCGIGAG